MMSREQYLLNCLAEECVEVAQRASKAIRFGLMEVQPGQGLTNKVRLEQELEDLLGVMRMLKLNPNPMMFKKKEERVEKYMAYSRDLGRVE